MWFEFLSISDIIQILLLIVTGGGAALIVKQLREARLASQMEGLMELNQQHQEIDEAMFVIRKIIKPQEWASISPEEQIKRLTADDPMIKTWRKIGSFHEMLGLLVRSNSFDIEIAYRFTPLIQLAGTET